MVLREPDVGAAGGDKSAGRVALALERGLHGGPQFLEAPGQHAGDDGGQIGEMRVDRRRGDARPPGDAPQGESGRVVRLVDDSDRGRDNLFAQVRPTAARVLDTGRCFHVMTLHPFAYRL